MSDCYKLREPYMDIPTRRTAVIFGAWPRVVLKHHVWRPPLLV
jgi:hypothetical protein